MEMFGCKGYYVDTVGRNKKVIEEYIKNQIQEDLSYEQMSLKYRPIYGLVSKERQATNHF